MESEEWRERSKEHRAKTEAAQSRNRETDPEDTIWLFVTSKITKKVLVQFHSRVYFLPLPRLLVAQTVRTTETSPNNTAIAVFWGAVVLMATVLMVTTGTSKVLTIGFRLGCSVMNLAIGGLVL